MGARDCARLAMGLPLRLLARATYTAPADDASSNPYRVDNRLELERTETTITMTTTRARSLTRLRTSERAYQPEELIETPQAAGARDRNGYAWGKHLLVQQTCVIVLAVRADNHAGSEILEHITSHEPKLVASASVLRKICKVMCLTGLLVPYIEPLPQSRRRFMFFLPWGLPDRDGTEWPYLLTIDEANDRVSDPAAAITNRWVE